MTKMLAVVAFTGIAGLGAAVSAGSSSAQLTVGVTVVRSCAVDARPTGNASPFLRLSCTAGTQSTVRVSETAHTPTAAVASEGDKVLTLNF
jgi:hypothetical protein